MDPLIGRTLDNKYLIEKLLGKGGMGSVYQAIHTGTKRTVAVKVIAPQFMRNRELLIRFQREAEASGRLRHPNVVNVTDFGVTVIDVTQVAYLVMEYLDGETLHEYLQKEPIPPPAMTVDIIEQIALGVAEAHSRGILHRDLKPQNIWLQPDGRGGYIVKVLDFGIAKLADPSSLAMELPEMEAAPNVDAVTQDENATQMIAPTDAGITSAFAEASGFTTTVGATLGTPAFMSPEQCSGMAVSEKSDLYSLAMLSYMMLAGELPFKGNARELIEQQISLEPDPPHKRNPKLSEIISKVVVENLSKQPERRAPNVLSFVSRLRAVVEGEVNLLKESRQLNGRDAGTWMAIVLMAMVPAAALLTVVRTAVRFAMDREWIPEPLAFLIVLAVHIKVAYLALVWTDMAMAAWTGHLREHESSVKAWFLQMWRSWKAYPAGSMAAAMSFRPLSHGIAHLVVLLEGRSVAEARVRSEQLLLGSEHLVLALVIRRMAIAWLVALYIPLVFIIAQAPVRFIFRETIGGGFGESLSLASFSFMPVYGSFLMAWGLLYERAKRGLGESGTELKKRYSNERGKIGERVRLGTKLWGGVPIFALIGMIMAPMLGWNERSGDTLSLAIREGREKDAVQLLEKGADPNQGRGPGSDPLLLAVQIGDEKIARLLVAKGAKMDPPPKTGGSLHFAVSRRRPEMVRLLLELGAKVNLQDDRENTPLILAAKSGQVEIVRMLLARQADVSLRDQMGQTALEAATKQGHAEIVKLLETK